MGINNDNKKTKLMLIFKGEKDNRPGNFSPVTEGYILCHVQHRPRSSDVTNNVTSCVMGISWKIPDLFCDRQIT